MAALRFRNLAWAAALLANPALVFGQFQPGTPFPVGSNPNSVAIADFNGDGKPDLAITNPAAGTVTVLPGLGGGKFQTPGTAYPAGTHPTFLLAGDFNKDGFPDLVVTNPLNNTITVLLNDKTGKFPTNTPPPSYSTDQGPVFLAAIDYNGDGYPDLAVANGLANTVSVLTNDQHGGFGSQAQGSPFAVGGFPSSIAVGDVNNDGKADLAVANLSTNNITILLANTAASSGGSTPPPAFMALSTGPIAVPAASPSLPAAQSAPISIALGDVNGDGYPDLAIANEAASTVTVLLNNTKLGFTPSPFSPYTLGAEPVFLSLADLNWDGHPDLAIVGMNGTVTVLLGNALGGFTPSTGSPYTVGASPLGLAIGDVNNDGKPDLVTANSGDGSVTVLLNNFAGLSILSAITGQQPVAPGSLINIYGTNLAAAPVTASIAPLPILLGGVSASVTFSNGSQVYLPLYYVSPGQINAVLPQTTVPLPGAAVINVFTASGTVSGPVGLVLADPGLLTVSGGLTGVAYGEAVTLQGAFQITNLYACAGGTCAANPISVSGGATELVLYGTGFENAAAGSVSVVIGVGSPQPVPLTPVYYGPTGTPGMDEVVVPLPASLAGRSLTTATVVVAGIASNSVMFYIQ